jgi:hypothetical protein
VLRATTWKSGLREYLCFCTRSCVSICTFVLANLVGPTVDVLAASPLCSAQEPYMLVHAIATLFDLALVPGGLEV